MRFIKVLTVIGFILIIDFKTGIAQDKGNDFETDVIKIGIVTSDLQATLDFYINVIGLSKVREFSLDSATATRFGFTNGVPFHVTCLKTNNSPQATEIKIISFGANDKYKKPKLLPDNLGMQYMTIYMKTLIPLIYRLRANNIKCLGQTPTPSGNGGKLILVQDPNGVFVELIGKE